MSVLSSSFPNPAVISVGPLLLVIDFISHAISNTRSAICEELLPEIDANTLFPSELKCIPLTSATPSSTKKV